MGQADGTGRTVDDIRGRLSRPRPEGGRAGDVVGGELTSVQLGGPPPSLNQMQRIHWARRKQIQDEWAEEIAVAAIEAGRPRFRCPLIQLRLYYPVQRRRDADNAIGGPAEIILDGLKSAGVIEDDNTQAIQLASPVIAVDPDEPRVEIVLTELAEGRTAG